MPQASKRKFSLRITVGGMFVFATIMTGLVAIMLQYYFAKDMAKGYSLARYQQAANTITDHLNKLDADAAYTTQLLAKVASLNSEGIKPQGALLKTFAQALEGNDTLYSVYVGNEDDEFFQLVNLESSPLVREKIGAEDRARWALVKHTGEGQERIRVTYFYNQNFNQVGQTVERSNYFPTQRSWYTMAVASGELSKTDPYLFHNLKITGQSYSQKIGRTNAVLGVDIVLSSITTKMKASMRVSDGKKNSAQAYLYFNDGELIATNQSIASELELPPLEKLSLTEQQKALVKDLGPLKVSNQDDWDPIDFSITGMPKGYAVDLLNLVADSAGLKFEYINGRNWGQLVADFEDGNLDILHSVLTPTEQNKIGMYSDPIYELPFGLMVTKEQATKDLDWTRSKIGMLTGWSIIDRLREKLPEIEIVTYDSLKDAASDLENGVISGILDTAPILNHKISQKFYTEFAVKRDLDELNGLSTTDYHLVMAPENAAVLDLINQALTKITPSHREALASKWLESDHGRPSATYSAYVPHKEIMDVTRDALKHGGIEHVTINGEQMYLFVTPLSETQKEFFSIVIPESVVMKRVNERVLHSIGYTIAVLILVIPVAWVFGTPIVNPINQLREETRKIKQRQFDEVKHIDTRIKEVSELSYAICDMSKEIQNYEKSQEEFVEAFIQLIAQAIDDKSPYTAGHCNRVPEIGLMLAEAAEKSQEAPFKEFGFTNRHERREFRIAAWLHDCGKITTPEHIVDKGTKLEANYNRIHEIRTRFEVLWRDAEISALRKVLDGAEQHEQAMENLEKQRQTLQEQFAFIANANVGGEFMSDEHIERIKEIAQIEWQRHFDNRLGLGPLEETKLPEIADELPAVEKLLSDKPEHIIPRDRQPDFDPKFGINVDVPEHLYNLGEVYNLSIRRGTLTAEDRYKINEHMTSGIKMLESLPFPEELARVPRYASTHHETLKGTGYPRKLTGDQLSIPERILVIADIFEALTAADRPYKKAKPLSVAVDIMYKMALDEHFDMALFRLFLSSGVYLDYARQYLPESQIDEVDISRYLSDA